MVDYVKFKSSSPLSRKSKKFDGTRYKEYLYGSMESLDTNWADKIVDFNPDLKLNTNGFTKYVDRNVSMSTECGFELKSSLNSNVDMYPSEDLNQSTSDFVINDAKHQFGKNGLSKASLSTNEHPSLYVDKTVLNVVEYQKFEELQKKYDELSSEFSKFKLDHQSSINDAELYRSCQERMSASNPELESEDDPKQSLELLLDHIYSILADTFGYDNTLVSYLEKFANIYVDYHNNVEIELATLRGKAEIIGNLDKLVSDKVNHDKLIEQKDKTIESLVDELKTSKLDFNSQLTKLKDDFDTLSNNFHLKTDVYKKELDKFKTDNESLTHSVTHLKNEYNKLLSDQHQILSQLPFATLKSAETFSSNKDTSESGPKHALSTTLSKKSLVPFFSGKNLKNLNGAIKAPDKDSSVNFDNHFLQSLVESLYRKNEEALDIIRKKDELIKKQNDTISRLKESVKEWESDAVLWLDYVDQTSSILKDSK